MNRVVVTCYLSCTVQGEDPASDSQRHLADMNGIMERVCYVAEARILDRRDNSPGSQKRYEDKLCVIKYEVDLDFWHPTPSQACSHLTSAFSDFMKSSPRSPGKFYYLAVYPSIREDLPCYFYDQELETFSLGFMSNAAKFHKQFDYQTNLWLNSFQKARATFEEERVLIDFAVSHGQRFHKVPPGQIATKTEVYRLSVDYQHMSPTVIVNSVDGAVDLCFLTTTPIQLWRTQFDITSLDRRDFNKTNWFRSCSITSGSSIANQKAFTKATLAGCNALKLRFGAGKDIRGIMDSLYHWCHLYIYHTVLEYASREQNFPDAPFIEMAGATADKINWTLAAIHSIGYRVQYQLKDLNISRRFMEDVNKHLTNGDNRRHLLNALSKTYHTVFSDSDKFSHIDRVLADYLNGPKELNEFVTTTQRMIKRIIITPTRILLQPPSRMHDNRILRAFDPDSAVRCSFQNDDMTSLGNVTASHDFINEAVGNVLRTGVTVARRHYQFLGCSGSQLKTKGCWLYAKDGNGNTVEDIRKWMGELDKIFNPGTYLSRMGQCFSDTTAAPIDEAIDITWNDPDIKGGKDPRGTEYCFSDGIGRISEECMREVMIRMPTGQKLPSAFQVRLGGAKGMLALDKNLTGKKILVRDSMRKFECTNATVEVMRKSVPTPLFLNHQIITLLSQVHGGVPDHVFIGLLYKMLHRLADVLLEDNMALTALTQSGFPCCYSKLHRNKFKFTTDPFFKGILKAITCARINRLKLKARIEIPHEYGRTMLGVMDEYGVLEYGEVFVQYSADVKDPKAADIVHEGDVVVSKMPALHPGDVRKLKAVDKFELHHLVDCIVFPQKGPRPHPNEMAGSDLDGDEYFVTWLPDLLFHGKNEAPMDFLSGPKTQQDRVVTVSDMIDFIVTYIANDKVPTIAHAHLAWADIEGIHSDRCKELAAIFCHVIDFNKTGYLPEKVKGKNIQTLLPEKYPDFMNKPFKNTYPSKNILGKLFRINERIEQAVMTIDKDDNERIKSKKNWNIDQRFFVPGHESYLEQAEQLYTIYADALDTDMKKYGIESEEELVSGCVIKIKGFYSRSDEVFDIERRVIERMKDVRKQIKEKFDEFLKVAETDEQSRSRHERLLAAACYVFTYSAKRAYRSFPWIFADILVKILQRTESPSPDGPLVQLTKSIDNMNMNRVDESFRLYSIERPIEDGLARIYHLLISWGHKSKFLKEDNPRLVKHDVLSVKDFACIIDRSIEDINMDLDTGPLLCEILKALTALPVDQARSFSHPGLINMKRQILICHHQLARDPRAETMLLRLQGRLKKTIQIHRQKWASINNRKDVLSKKYQDEYGISIQFRGKRHGGQIHVLGEEMNVFDFEAAWYDYAETAAGGHVSFVTTNDGAKRQRLF